MSGQATETHAWVRLMSLSVPALDHASRRAGLVLGAHAQKVRGGGTVGQGLWFGRSIGRKG